jgi:hypothetical protein
MRPSGNARFERPSGNARFERCIIPSHALRRIMQAIHAPKPRFWERIYAAASNATAPSSTAPPITSCASDSPSD